MRLLFFVYFFILIVVPLNAQKILHLKIDNAISPATSKHLFDGIEEAKKINSKLILIELNTPGGLVSSTREMVQYILNSEIPIVMYVSPKGSRAASAGTFLMYASHIAAMSPGTNIGAATPINLIETPNLDDKSNEKVKKIKSTLENKIINDTTAYIKSIAQLRNRNIEWAISAVKEGKSISANDALKLNVINLIAEDKDELLKKIDGQKVIIDKKEITINTQNANLVFFNTSWKTKLLMAISNPNIAYVFLILAMYGILFEMMNPGSIFPGVIGVVSALIAMYTLNILPFNYVGLLLIFLGVILMLMEVMIAGFGILGIAGVISFAFGSILLFDEKTLGLGLSIPIIAAFSLVSFGFFVYVLGFLIKSRKSKVTSGIECMIGQKAIVVEKIDNKYKILVNGELWSANSTDDLSLNDEVDIVKIDGLLVQIRGAK